jgi:hypothetical protein
MTLDTLADVMRNGRRSEVVVWIAAVEFAGSGRWKVIK